MFATSAESANVWKEAGKGVFVFDHTERIRKGTMERVIIRAYGVPVDKALELVGMVGVSSLIKNQIDGDDVIDKVGSYLIRLTTKNRNSIGIDVWKPKVDHSNERANCYTIG